VSRAAIVAASVAASGLIVWGAFNAQGGGEAPAKPSGVIRVVRGNRALLSVPARAIARLTPAQLSARLAVLPTVHRSIRGRAVVVYRTQFGTLRRLVASAARQGGGTVVVPERPVAASFRLGVVKQALRNNCETAALSMMLLGGGVRADQLRLQRELPESKPTDPQPAGAVPIWGDPDLGFVGRPDGGGPSGGYGVYPQPIRRLAAHHGVRLRRVVSRPAAVYRSLLSGRPVMTWIGLSDGPYMTWRTPGGRRISGNFGEHTVVLTGIRGRSVAVNDPLSGTRLSWSRPQFEALWRRLGRRALSL
jgi:uncharacterized protein YvpB